MFFVVVRLQSYLFFCEYAILKRNKKMAFFVSFFATASRISVKLVVFSALLLLSTWSEHVIFAGVTGSRVRGMPGPMARCIKV